jgi:N-acetylglutamate synthase-like GNAT family acetyltransferase
MEIRLANIADVHAMVPIINSAYSVETFLDGERTNADLLAKHMLEGQFLVAENETGIVATVYVELHGERAYFGMLAVDPSQQGTGLGRRMIEMAEDHARKHGCKVMDITVLSLRPELLPFYR